MIDPLSATWRETKARAEDAIAKATAAIVQPNCGEREADFHRGRIAALQDLLRLERAGKPTQQTGIGALASY